MELISVNDRFPDKDKLVFAINSRQYIGLAYHDGIQWIEASSNQPINAKYSFWSNPKPVSVTHWIESKEIE